MNPNPSPLSETHAGTKDPDKKTLPPEVRAAREARQENVARPDPGPHISGALNDVFLQPPETDRRPQAQMPPEMMMGGMSPDMMQQIPPEMMGQEQMPPEMMGGEVPADQMQQQVMA